MIDVNMLLTRNDDVFLLQIIIEEQATYRSRNEKAREQVEEGIECRSEDGGNLMVRGDRHRHHPIVGEVEKGEERDEIKPKKLGSRPLKTHHGVHYQ